MLLDSGMTVEETIEELQAHRAGLGPTFEFGNDGDGLAFINVFGAFK
jgi:hypothetical protein